MSERVSISLIWLSFLCLITLGLIMVASTSAYALYDNTTDFINPYVKQQCGLALAGIIAAIVIARMDYRLLKKASPYIWVFCVILLILCYVPGIGKNINGESRWIGLGRFTFQPSEIAKIGIMVCTANWYSIHRKVASSIWKGFVVPGIIFGIPVILILCEKDMGTAAALSLSGFCLMYAAGARWWLLLLALIGACFLLYFITTSSENRMMRIDAWRDIEGSKLGAGRQQWLSSLAFAKGGFWGVGIGGGTEKIHSLPEAHTDFIYATIGEELGLIGSAGVVIFFLVFAWSCINLALKTQDTFGRLVIISIASVICWPAMLNIMVVSGVVPNTGLPLPFISYGGTNLLITTSTIGLITSVYIHSPHKQKMYWPKKLFLNNIKRKP